MNKKILFALSFFIISAIIVVGQALPNKKGMVGLQLYESDKRFYIGKVFKNSPADRAGFQANDEITEVAGKSVKDLTLDQVLALFDGEPGEFVGVKVVRNNQEMSFNVSRVSPENLVEDSSDFKVVVDEKSALEGTHEADFAKSGLTPEELEKRWNEFFLEKYGFSGVMIDTDFAQRLGTFFYEGFLICHVDKSSPAASVLKKWDLIVKIEGRKINTYFESSQLINVPQRENYPVINATLMSVTGEAQISIKPIVKVSPTPVPQTNK